MKRACNQQQINERKKEIINTVNNMLDKLDYQDITMKSISENISIARSSLYCYYLSKEEIMLDVLKDNYLDFLSSLTTAFKDQKNIISNITNIYLNNIKLLKIISVYLTDIEMHCSIEKLIEFKKDFVLPFNTLYNTIKQTYINLNEEIVQTVYNSLLMLTHSLYPFLYPNNNQKQAMLKVGLKLFDDKYKFTYDQIKLIFSYLNEK